MKELIDFPYTDILVLGLAKSGTAAAKLLRENDLHVRVNDLNTKETDPVVTELQAIGVEVILGSHPLSVLDGINLLVKNPGIPYDNPVVKEAEQRGLPIITEIELAGRLVDGQIIGITGSNGKTTTTTLITEILASSKQRVKVAGNIGTVATEVAQTMTEDEKMVIELSSFQLLGIETFKPNIAVLLNLFEAHLDYHKTIEHYQQAKCNLFINQEKEDYLIYNADDPVVTEAVKKAKSILVPFSLTNKLDDGAWVDDSHVYFKKEKVIARKDIVLVGKHNLENILAAISTAKLCGATNEGIHTVLTTFSGVKHRLQFVTALNQRLFYNDSKATNMLATEKALLSFTKPTILLAGGLDRGNEFHDLLPYLTNVKGLILFGETANKLKAIGEVAGIKEIVIVESMEEAVQAAYAVSNPEDIILLSPACASWDQYKTFEERGDMFIDAVHKLA